MQSRIRTGLVSVTFRKLTVPQVVDAAATAGLQAIEWGGDVHVPPGDARAARAARQHTETAGLAVAAYGSYYNAGHNPPGDIDAVLATAVALDAPTVRIWAGRGGSKELDETAVARVVADVVRVCDLAAKQKRTITLEYHGGTLTDTLDSTVRLLDQIGRPNLRIGWQPRDGISADAGAQELHTLRPRLGNLHVFQWWPDGQTRLPLADGAERWATYLKAAAEDGTPRDALLEFVADDDIDQFFRDAVTFKTLIAATPE